MNKLKKLYINSIDKASSFMRESKRQLVISLLLYISVFVVVLSYFFFTGAGKWFDILLITGTAALALVLGIGITLILFNILRSLPRFLVSVIIACIAVIYSVGAFMGPFFRLMGFAVMVLALLLGITVFLYRKRKKALFLFFSFLTIGLHVAAIYLAVTDGKEGPWSLEVGEVTTTLTNPAESGSAKVQFFTYGSGKDERREEYKDVKYETQTVNMTSFVSQPKGLNKWYREWFWGFDLYNAPLNGRVWMPKKEEEGAYPLVLIVHGNHNMADFSDGGYAYLGEMLASKGYIVASVDQNFINSGKTGHIGWDNAGRAWLLLKHLELWQSWNEDKTHALYNRVDMGNIALIGHSRGGEAVSIAALFNELDRFPNNAKVSLNFDFSIKSLIGLSPGDGRFKPGDQPVSLQDVNYLTLQGGNDTDHTNYLGMRQFQRVSFSEDFDGFKSSVYIYGANHGQFNSDWEVDQPSPYWWFMNRKEIMEPETQREITKVYVSAFLDATLKGKRDYRGVFSDKEIASTWIPTDPLRVRYEDRDFQPIATFEEDVDVTKTTQNGGQLQGYNLRIWKEINLLQRNKEQQNNQVVKLGWTNKNSRFTIKLPEDVANNFSEQTVLKFDAVQAHPSRYEFYHIDLPEGYKNKPIPVSVSVKAKGTGNFDGRVRKTIYIEPTYTTTLYRFDWWNERYGNQFEHMLQTYGIPLNYLQENFPDIDYTQIEEVIFEFNQTDSGLVFIDNIGFNN
ncbi:MAG: hypothetical protein U9Q88_17085 [Bacillota bacterium]|uniref:poly(ethylene terephthalate) hydrolase family protein n=1 Tax=Bacillus sp. RO2 TaxID=2723913 RepID=UPI00145F82C9|nr:hypothetical protein [Bacillus sp. RO2]MEA3321705.1 hypothetical protein [Bacillota bacterium]NMH72621.1 hypothetical protein [Bacillus sp. RO2]